ncbi:hypothetical protein [Rhodococcus sp. HNM0569]|uniref:hypothetical protein n=1 Tax=Rhodococcus sp. HNM0569 TaxID=2716340 RepID=UPI001469FD22|nr:hypothetical protein [Rhodococcus sp. HNM0569]NLU84368.1 hypothetical protein [Rhodococcus sp. HNM0569]
MADYDIPTALLSPVAAPFLGPTTTVENVSLPSSDSTGVATGVTSFEAGWQLGKGIAEGDIGAAASGALGVGLDVASAASDPIGYVAAQCLSWMLEHIEPAREALDNLAGDPAGVKEYAQQWTGIETELMSVREAMLSAVASGTSQWSGAAADAYRAHAQSVADLAGGAAGGAHGISKLTEGMSEIVGGVRTAVRDLLSTIAGALVSWTIEILASVGVGTPVVVAQATSRIAQVVRTVSKLLKELGEAVTSATTQLTLLRDLFDGFYKSMQTLTAES